ncbi:hypothetical protein GJ744_006359 [Endocarpon pusillum]|uniref:Actin-like protein arp6 n=1 Tax=Endocarpon pusillum TaxID=364733 RepID=A0A8H7AK08_9EURO|nr:hypothetical protein GJ744_006359 [Endocarpon pusillum]
MPKATKPAVRDSQFLPSSTFILDNGAFSMKAGFAPSLPLADADTLKRCHVVQNSLARTRDKRTYVAAQQDNISQWSEAIFRRPVERGQLVNWEAEKEIWDCSFFDEKTAHPDLFVKGPDSTTLILTEAPNTMQALQRNADEIIMEEWGFGGYARIVGQSLNAYNDLHPLFGETDRSPSLDTPPRAQECLLVVDSGYSHTIITPLYNGVPVQRAIRRVDLGGKHLTNLLKEVVSLRYFDLHQDTKIVNDIKEDVCFVSPNYKMDMEQTWKGNTARWRKSEKSAPPTLEDNGDNEGAMDVDKPSASSPPCPVPDPPGLIDYVLPDGFRIHRGFSRPHDPLTHRKQKRQGNEPSSASGVGDEISMTLGSERFSIPEILFTPSDIGSRQPGIAEAVMQSLSVLPPSLQATLLSNILVVGGNARMEGFVRRIQDELRMLAPVEYEVRVRAMEDPVTSTWLGGARMAGNREVVRKIGVSKEEYAEFGSGWVGRRFSAAGR